MTGADQNARMTDGQALEVLAATFQRDPMSKRQTLKMLETEVNLGRKGITAAERIALMTDAERIAAVEADFPRIVAPYSHPSFWTDAEVRRPAITLHRKETIDGACRHIAGLVDAERVPSKSALAEFWRRLDVFWRRAPTPPLTQEDQAWAAILGELPPFWRDRQVTAAVAALRPTRDTIAAMLRIAERFGDDRTPHPAAIDSFWAHIHRAEITL